jgi:hypothetical protein
MCLGVHHWPIQENLNFSRKKSRKKRQNQIPKIDPRTKKILVSGYFSVPVVQPIVSLSAETFSAPFGSKFVLDGDQGDHIGRIFAYWAFVYFGQFFYYRTSPNICATLFHGESYELILTKNRSGYFLADLFTNSSGHPDGDLISCTLPCFQQLHM